MKFKQIKILYINEHLKLLDYLKKKR